MVTWSHDQLQNDLAAHLVNPRRLAWTNMPLGPAGSPRPDVYTMDKSFAHPNAVSYECKVSVSDFRSDVTSGKWQAYLSFSNAVYFATPAGLISKADLPDKCGWIVRHAEVWRVMRRAVVEAVQIPSDVYLKLIIDGTERAHAIQCGPRELVKWQAEEKIRKKFGQRVADILRDQGYAESRIKRAREEANEIVAKAREEVNEIIERERGEDDQQRQMIADALGVEIRDHYSMLRAIRSAAVRLTKDGEVAHLRAQLEAIRKALNGAAPLPVASPEVDKW